MCGRCWGRDSKLTANGKKERRVGRVRDYPSEDSAWVRSHWAGRRARQPCSLVIRAGQDCRSRRAARCDCLVVCPGLAFRSDRSIGGLGGGVGAVRVREKGRRRRVSRPNLQRVVRHHRRNLWADWMEMREETQYHCSLRSLSPDGRISMHCTHRPCTFRCRRRHWMFEQEV